MMLPRDPGDLRGRIADLAVNQVRLANAVLALALAIKDLAQARTGVTARASEAVDFSDAVFDATESQMMGRVT